MNQARLEELERLEAEATAGPWKACGCGRCGLVWSLPLDTTVGNARGQPESDAECVQLTPEQQSTNAELGAALRNSAKELIQAAKAQRWIPVAEAPGTERRCQILAWAPEERVAESSWHPELGYEGIGPANTKPTHWMPIPSAPESDDGGGR